MAFTATLPLPCGDFDYIAVTQKIKETPDQSSADIKDSNENTNGLNWKINETEEG